MFLILTVIIAILAPLIHSRIPTEAEIKAGKVAGFTGATNSRVGDYLLSTTCFCGSEGNEPHTYPNKGASLMLYEYYMYHHNTTYMLNSLCRDAHSLEDCFTNRDINPIHDGYLSLCDTWIVKRRPGPGGKRKKDLKHTMCYLRDVIEGTQWDNFGLPIADKITFDGFTRGLGTGGGQAPTLRSVEEADARCEVLCEQQTGLPVFKEDLQTDRGQLPIRNHMIGWEDLDDMCGKCK